MDCLRTATAAVRKLNRSLDWPVGDRWQPSGAKTFFFACSDQKPLSFQKYVLEGYWRCKRSERKPFVSSILLLNQLTSTGNLVLVLGSQRCVIETTITFLIPSSRSFPTKFIMSWATKNMYDISRSYRWIEKQCLDRSLQCSLIWSEDTFESQSIV